MRGSIRKRGNSYQIKYDIGIDPITGNRRQKSETCKTKKEAERRLAQRILELENGTFVESNKILLKEYLEKWLDIHKTKIAESTYSRYKQYIYSYFVPYLGTLHINKIKPLHIQDFYAKMLNQPKARGKGNISPTSVFHAHAIIHKALKDAVKWQMISTNPADAVTPPKRAKKVCRVAMEEDIKILIEDSRDTYMGIIIFLAISTGARRGEILGLKWSEVDLKKGLIIIKQTLSRRVDGTLDFIGTKTPKSRRSIEIGAETIKMLKEHHKLQKEWRLKAGQAWQDNNLVCCWQDGSPMAPNTVSASFCKIAKKLGLNIGFHDLRHTHATMLLKAGTNPKIVSERLGHSTVGMTLDTYSHVLPTMQKEAASVIERCFM